MSRRDGAVRGVLRLLKAGVPWHIAIVIPEDHVTALSIAIEELESGKEFDFQVFYNPKNQGWEPRGFPKSK